MRSILLTSVAVAALASPAFAGPDRFEHGVSCSDVGATNCVQQMRSDDANRATDRSSSSATSISSGLNGSTSVGVSQNGDNDGIEDEIGDAGHDVGAAADEAGDAIGHAANEAGDAIDDATDEVGDAIGDVFD